MVTTQKLLFTSMLEEDAFLDNWEKSNVVSIHKKEIKNIDQSVSFQFLVKFLKDSYLIHYLITLYKITFHRVSIRLYTW